MNKKEGIQSEEFKAILQSAQLSLNKVISISCSSEVQLIIRRIEKLYHRLVSEADSEISRHKRQIEVMKKEAEQQLKDFDATFATYRENNDLNKFFAMNLNANTRRQVVQDVEYLQNISVPAAFPEVQLLDRIRDSGSTDTLERIYQEYKNVISLQLDQNVKSSIPDESEEEGDGFKGK